MEFFKRYFTNITLNKILVMAGGVTFLFIIAFIIWFWQDNDIVVANDGREAVITNSLPTGSLTGTACENADNRALAVMLSSDPVARPLSGLSEADMVFEMPVTPGEVTRMMAVYQCSEPSEIGSVRSAREAFIPLAGSVNAVLVHWGGEREALSQLNAHIIDNIDAMRYENLYFSRKPKLREPHNGFANYNKLVQGISALGYPQKNNFTGYPRQSKNTERNLNNLADIVTIDYASPFDVKWFYNQVEKNYSRTRNGKPEIDKNSNEQVKASVVVVMKTTADVLNKDYNRVRVSGSGETEVYQDGIKINGTWKKDPDQLDGKLFFYDNDGKEIQFVPGKIWVEIITH
jgi:hypothetical protein